MVGFDHYCVDTRHHCWLKILLPNKNTKQPIFKIEFTANASVVSVRSRIVQSFFSVVIELENLINVSSI
jgi:hypothetical protein